jgi:hypothetical protein
MANRLNFFTGDDNNCEITIKSIDSDGDVNFEIRESKKISASIYLTKSEVEILIDYLKNQIK